MQIISLFPVEALDPIEDRANQAIASIRQLLEAGRGTELKSKLVVRHVSHHHN
ncbi:hypothetical protein [Cupriavidus numazuensis]|uniref:Uncharacterized protein n=1 Tax=Cupriavidus numazuensis TaxID=221992 RepID=A0ABN7QBZ2_9BURK|nr:hypothetical protein [Cupriavidus numazuensis]CAG2161017.1 hypothetical protein LMG26411_07939 [Cupriavidus numazuensis]